MKLCKPHPASLAQCPRRRPASSTSKKSSGVGCGLASLRLGRHQAHFFPFPGPLSFPGTAGYCANHGSITFGNHMLVAFCRKNAIAFLVFSFQSRLSSTRTLQRRGSNRTHRYGKPVVFPEPLGRLTKGVFHPEVAQRPIQRPAFALRRDACHRSKHPFEALRRTSPDPFLHLNLSEHRPPTQGFFFPQ